MNEDNLEKKVKNKKNRNNLKAIGGMIFLGASFVWSFYVGSGFFDSPSDNKKDKIQNVDSDNTDLANLNSQSEIAELRLNYDSEILPIAELLKGTEYKEKLYFDSEMALKMGDEYIEKQKNIARGFAFAHFCTVDKYASKNNYTIDMALKEGEIHRDDYKECIKE